VQFAHCTRIAGGRHRAVAVEREGLCQRVRRVEIVIDDEDAGGKYVGRVDHGGSRLGGSHDQAGRVKAK
jgi:hypothetical protein